MTPASGPGNRLATAVAQAVAGTGDVPSSVHLDPDTLRALEYHKLTAMAATLLRGNPVDPPEAARQLDEARRRQLTRHLAAMSDLALLQRTFAPLGIDWLTFKGPALSVLAYPRPDLRQFSDLDILVRPSHFGDALEALEAAGATLVDQNWQLIDDRDHAEISVLLPSGLMLDMHWHAINQTRLRRAFRIDPAQLLEHSRSATIGPATVKVLDPIDALVHTCLHAGLSGAHTLLWMLDVALIARAVDAPPGQVEERTQSYGATLLVSSLLTRAHRALGLDPPAILPRPRRSAWLTVTSLANRRWPPGSVLDGGTSGRVVFESTRATSATSLGALARRLATHRSASPGEDNLALSADWQLLHQASPDPGARARYLNRIGEHA